MENFIYDIPTKVFFGKGQITMLHTIIPDYGKHVLLVYGSGSIKRNGVYDQVLKEIYKAKAEVQELSGVEANPQIETVRKGVQLCEKFHIDMIIAVGGGSVIDCAKAIAASFGSGKDAWKLIEEPSNISEVLPVIAVSTMAATGSEMDGIAVISDYKKKEKRPLKHSLIRPKAAILDPVYTYSVSPVQTAAGISDIFSHLMETYFSKIEGYMQKRLCEGLMKTCIHNGLLAYNDGNNYEARANLMWTASWAINDFLKAGQSVTWSVHAIEHQLSAYYDITHGIGLAVLTPTWMEHILNESTISDFARFAREVWDVTEKDSWKAAQEGIKCLRAFFAKLQLPQTLQQTGICERTYFEEMAEKALPYLKGTYVPLTKEDIIRIYEKSF